LDIYGIRELGLKFTCLAAALTVVIAVYGCGDDLGTCSGPFCVSPGAPEAAKLKMGSGDGQQGVPERQLPDPIDVIVTDSAGRPVGDVTVSFSVAQGGGTLSSPSIKSDGLGHARVTWVLGPDPGDQFVQVAANSPGGDQLDGSPLTVSAHAVRPPPARLILSTGPSETAQNGIPFAQQPVVQVMDAGAQPLPGVQVVASIASGQGTLNGTATVVSDGSGIVTYTDLAIAGAAGPRTLRFSTVEPALEVVSGIIQVNAGTVASLAGVPPLTYEEVVGSPVSPAPSVVVKDAAGNPVAGVPVDFTPDQGALVSPTTVNTDEDGIAQVASWTLGPTANVQYSLSASIAGSGLAPVVFSATAKSGAAGRLQIATQPSSTAQNGVALPVQPVIQIADQNGNPAPQGNVSIRATISSGSGTLSSSVARTDGSGKATFSGLTVTGKVGNYTISFSARGLAGVASTPVALSAGAPTQLALVSAAPAARSRVLLNPQPVIQVQDVSGNSVPQAGIPVVAALSGTAALGGQTTVQTDANGAAIYTDLSLTGPPGAQTLTFTSTDFGAATTPVTLPNPATIELSQGAPASAVVASSLSNPAIWILKDAAGQILPDVPVTLAASEGGTVVGSGASGEGGGVQAGTWTLAPTAGDQFVQVTVTGTTLMNAVHIQATPGPAASLLLVSGNNQIDSVNTQLDSLLVVRLIDQFSNGIGGVIVQWRSCDGAGNYDDLTTPDGFSSATQETGPQAGTFCTRATSAGFSVDFTYTVTPGAAPASQLLPSQDASGRTGGPAPTAPATRADPRRPR
jgi:adhesin/invasin